MDYDCDLLRNVKQEAVSHQLTIPLSNVSIVECGEKGWAQPFNGQAAGIVIKVVLPVIELPIVKQDQVVITSLEEGGRTSGRTSGSWGKRRGSGGRRGSRSGGN